MRIYIYIYVLKFIPVYNMSMFVYETEQRNDPFGFSTLGSKWLKTAHTYLLICFN